MSYVEVFVPSSLSVPLESPFCQAKSHFSMSPDTRNRNLRYILLPNRSQKVNRNGCIQMSTNMKPYKLRNKHTMTRHHYRVPKSPCGMQISRLRFRIIDLKIASSHAIIGGEHHHHRLRSRSPTPRARHFVRNLSLSRYNARHSA